MSNDSNRSPTWQERHAGTIIGAVLFTLLALVITFQVAC